MFSTCSLLVTLPAFQICYQRHKPVLLIYSASKIPGSVPKKPAPAACLDLKTKCPSLCLVFVEHLRGFFRGAGGSGRAVGSGQGLPAKAGSGRALNTPLELRFPSAGERLDRAGRALSRAWRHRNVGGGGKATESIMSL